MKGCDRKTAGCFVAHRRYLASQCHKGKAVGGGILEPMTFALCRAAVLFSSFNLCAKSNLGSFNREIPPQNNNLNLHFSVGGHKSNIQSIIVSRHVTAPALIQVNISDLLVASVAAVWGQRERGGGRER